MNSHKDGKSAAKALKKSQKITKKQQQKGSNNVIGKNARNAGVAVAATPTTPANASQYGVNKITGKTMKTAATINNNNTAHNNNVASNASVPPPQYEGPPKFERSNSFSIRLGKISKIFNSLTGSKENLTKLENEPFKFTRSRSMIMPGRFNRRSLIEPQLEQLSEETERSGDLTSPASPRKNSLNTTQPPWSKPPITVTVTPQMPDCVLADPTTKDYKTPRRKSSQVMTSTPLEDGATPSKPSSVSLATNGVENAAVYNPQLNFQKRRSSTLIASFKSTLSGLTSGALTGEKKKEKLNPKWSASLQSLQAIDNMVSYDNMSFIDYDKFNGYEKQLEKQLSSLSLSQSMGTTALGDAVSLGAPPTPTSQTSLPVACSVPLSSPQTVVRRRKKRSVRSSGGGSQRSSYTFDTDYEHNLDKPKNVYRYSLDSRKLELLNEVSRSSFIWDKHIVDVLNLEDGSVGRRKTQCLHTRAMDIVDGMQQLKSKSLTHLDGLDSMVACQHGPATKPAVSSSEFFSVSFYTENGCQEEEFIPASKGVALSSALSQVLQRRNLSFSQITITDNNSHELLGTGTASLANSLDENTDVEHLAGHHLIVSERDGSRKTLQKAASFGSRTRPPRLLSSASTEETTEPSDQRVVPGKQLKQRWSGLFGIRNPQQSQLCELLNNYAKMGVPQRSAALNFDHPDFDAAQEYLDSVHKSWKDFVHCDEMSDSETKIQTAIWELVTTEVYYIHALQTVTDLFLACLEAVQDEKLLTDVDQQRLFSNVRDICEANLKFWTLYLYPMVANSVATREPLRIAFFQPGFSNFAAIFAPYKKYCAEQSTCQFYCKELNRTNALFTSYLAWCESQKMCNRLRLADILVRPMQRLTKYSLLLAAIKKHMTDEENMETVDIMMHTVENFVCSVNNHLTTRQETERLKGVMARIECYDVVDTNNEMLDKMVKQHSQMFDLCAPMKGCATHQVRHLFMEGDHKFKDHLGKADVHCFLLTDMLLVCKTIAKKGLGALKVIRQPYLTDRLMVHHSSNTNILNCVYLNEFHVAVTAFTLQCSEAKNWYESLKRTKIIYTRLKQGGHNWDGFRFGIGGISSGTADSLSVKKSPMNSSICSHVTSTNNSHSGSVEWNDSRNISVDFDKTNSLSSDEGSSLLSTSHAFPLKMKNMANIPQKLHVITSSANTLSVQPLNLLGQSLPNLNLHQNQTNNTLLVPGTTSSHSGNLLLSPSHRGISYPPPSPTRVPLRRGMAFSASIKNPPLLKTRNITSQNSINWHQIPATPTPTSPQTAQNSSSCYASGVIGTAGGGPVSPTADAAATSAVAAPLSTNIMQQSGSSMVASNETDV